MEAKRRRRRMERSFIFVFWREGRFGGGCGVYKMARAVELVDRSELSKL